MDNERTGSFQPSLSAASNSAEAALFQFRSNILLCQPTGMSWRKIMLSGSLYFWCQTGAGFGGWPENRSRSQGAQEVQATKANSKALLLCARSPRSAVKWTGLGSVVYTSSNTALCRLCYACDAGRANHWSTTLEHFLRCWSLERIANLERRDEKQLLQWCLLSWTFSRMQCNIIQLTIQFY